MKKPNIQVLLTGESEVYCFKLVFSATPGTPDAGVPREPVEIYLHTTQAIELHHQLSLQLSAYFQKASAELLEIKKRSQR